ncbi:ABC transporter permease [Prosthecomicrobium hirschii]|jgi:polar amino acid transport system permease protein|uniref:Glutamate/aspartate import permease protein GltK n=1 Tax=Prosthecodimorpha hirschii TaxID=665126 RepID=A0A0P6VN26_9HYPH|nr:amino acid ABC transporter permease [Prosthecomicrobium hirschii]KPL52701.1 ABC transporter permease [Prosthecomicrobium hirschii]TPQ49115.1 amino acid ABC transporter permease [Prosthecomicrobium hirschii]
MKVWNWEGFFSYFVNGYLLTGALVTLALAAATLAIGFVLGMVLVLFRLSGNPILSGYARFHVWLFRGTPLLVQLIIIYTGLPQLGLARFSVIESALIGLALNEAAYLSEILRGGILSVHQGQRDAAYSLGLNRSKTFLLIVMPQALRVSIPALGNSVNGLLKTTSIASVISMEELLRRGQILMQQRFEVLEVFTCIAILYLCMTTLWEMVQRRIEAHFAKGYAAKAPEDDSPELARDAR